MLDEFAPYASKAVEEPPSGGIEMIDGGLRAQRSGSGSTTRVKVRRMSRFGGPGSAHGRRQPSEQSRGGSRDGAGSIGPSIDEFSASDVRFGEPGIPAHSPSMDALANVSGAAPKKV